MGSRAWRAAALTLALLLPALPATAAEGWTLSPEVTLRFTATDNVAQTAGGGEGDFITQVTPGLRIQGAGARFRANLHYAPSAIFYARNDQADGVANSLTAFASLEAVEKFFFVDVTGNISQQFLSPFSPQPGDITTISENRTETRSFGLMPHLRGQLGRFATYELRNRNLWTTSDRTALADAHTRQWSGSLRSVITRFGWALEFDDTEIAYDDDFVMRPEQRSSLGRARLFWQPDISWRFSVSAGRERNNYIGGEDRYHTMRGAGVTWSPGVRTTADLEYERRFFGPSRLARLRHRTRLTAWEVRYSKDTTNYQQESLRLPPGNTAALLDAIFAARIPDEAQRAAAVIDFLRNSGTPLFLSNPLSFFTQQIFLQERAEASVGILGVRHSVTFSIFAADSTALAEGIGALLPELGLPGRRVRQHGFGVSASHRLTPFTTLTATGGRSFASHEEPEGRDTRNDNLALNATFRVAPKTNTFAGVSHTRFSGELPGDNRKASSIHAGLTHQF